MLRDGIKPWHRLPSETDEAYTAFCLYLNMGSKRSLYELIATMDSTPLSVEEVASWSTTFAWTKRVELCEQFIQEELLNSSTYPSNSNVSEYTLVTISTTQAEKRVASNFPAKRKARYHAH
jgi:hypothetical protein